MSQTRPAVLVSKLYGSLSQDGKYLWRQLQYDDLDTGEELDLVEAQSRSNLALGNHLHGMMVDSFLALR